MSDVDTHGEYGEIAESLSAGASLIDVELRRALFEGDTVTELLRAPGRDPALMAKLHEVADTLVEGATVGDFIDALRAEARDGNGVRSSSSLRMLPRLRATSVFVQRRGSRGVE
jgi:hypothetical protein